jgi:hypothetical protein
LHRARGALARQIPMALPQPTAECPSLRLAVA